MSTVIEPRAESETTNGPARAAAGPRGSSRLQPGRHSHTALVLTVGLLLWLYVGLVVIHTLHNPALVQFWFLLSAAIAPGTLLWVMVHRLRPGDTLTATKLVTTAVVGGAFAIALGGTLDALVSMNRLAQPGHTILLLSLAGVMEEASKAALVVILGWRVAKTARNGLFLGGAVGIGFAVIETMFYVATSYQGTHPLLPAIQTGLLRGLSSPFGHPLWSALLGAAIFAAAGRTQRFRLTFGVIAAYVGVAVAHGVWDGGAPGLLIALHLGGPGSGNPALLTELVVDALVACVMVPIWRHVVKVANRSAFRAVATSFTA